jgi:hypothetical protein
LNLIDAFLLFELFDYQIVKFVSFLTAGCLVKNSDPILDARKAHVNLMCRPLKFEDGPLPPLGQQEITGIDKSRNSHEDQQERHRQNQKERKSLLQTFRLYHGLPPTSYILRL